ncbi:MAG: glutamate--tRNA ligase, partial [Alphaproteobacteria bacterium]
MTTKVRFAPSPTGFLHVGNIRIAIINYLFAKKTNGEFLLRFDDTDSSRVEKEYSEMIFTDMNWLGLKYDNFFKESDRLARYEQAKNQLIANGKLYECFETAEELNLQRKSQNASGVSPIYNRASLKLTQEQKNELRNKGLKPHYRFLLNDSLTSWDDKIKGKITYEGRHFSDPILIRQEDESGFGIPTYTFCSVVDDIDYGITDIIRGEDHITNTAIQIQIFEALNAKAPNFAHLALVKASEGKISKREGGFDIKTLRNQGYEAMSIISLLSQIGTSQNINITDNFNDLIA